MLTVLEYMKENPNTWQDYVYNCNGSYQNGDYTIKCYHGTAHGAQNLIQHCQFLQRCVCGDWNAD